MEVFVIFGGFEHQKNKANPSTSLRTSLLSFNVPRDAYCERGFEKTKPIFEGKKGRIMKKTGEKE